MKRVSFSTLVCWIFILAALLTAILIGKWKKKAVLKWDVSSYYVYLPALLIYHDLFHLDFYNTIDSVYRPSGDLKRYAMTPYSLTRKRIIKYPVGVALFEIPAFGLAWLCCLIDTDYLPDGWSEPFQLAIAFNSILFVFLGLLYLRRFLKIWFSDMAVAITLLILATGTNLFFYSCFEPGLSHPYLFFLFCMVLYYMERWYKTPSIRVSVVLGLAIGMAVITRPTGLWILVFPLFWRTPGYFSFSEKAKLLRREWEKIGIVLFSLLIPVFLQLLYWKITTGYWLYYSYEEEGFNFSDWHILDGLFGYRKGWFIYTPFALLGFLGLAVLWFTKAWRFYLLPFFIYFIPLLYLVFSWWLWWYGGGFGSRVMVESLSVLAFPMAALIERLIRSHISLKLLFSLILLAGISLNLFQSWQYNKGIIHWDSMNKAYYWRVFGKTNITDKDVRLLNPSR